MLFCETAGGSRADAEDLAVFASQLAALGVATRIPVEAVPEKPGRNLQFDLAPHLADGRLAPGDGLVLLAADRLNDAGLARLRRLADGNEVRARAFGRFAQAQTALGARARLAYVFGREPELFDTTPADPEGRAPAPAFGVPRRAHPVAVKGAPVRLLLVGPDLEDPQQAAAVSALALRRSLRLALVADARAKEAWCERHGRDIPFYQYSEILPAALAERADVCVFYGGIGRSYRLQALAANLTVSGAALLDGTHGHALSRASDAFIAAPPGVIGLDGFLDAEIVPNLAGIAQHVRQSRAAAAADPAPVLRFLGVEEAAPRRRRPAPAAGGIVFMPTNGVGLGHAQRCTLIAGALDTHRPKPVFAAFPSCTRLIKERGFDVMPLLGRSALHAQSHEHDLGNYLRLRALAKGARTLVFDGGYVFDSVYRTVLEEAVSGVWIRRGLWQSTQDNAVALDREKAFDRVIVPAEAFEELNAEYSRGAHLHSVGPIVARVELAAPARAALREGLAERHGREFRRLAVTCLGGGVAADRSAQIQALAGLFERRSDTLHLVLVWPTATLEPAWFGWRNTRVIRTQHAPALAAAADLVVTAAGYNSFHEALYNRVPAIFVPQMSSYMDDQRARARAAVERGLAAMVEETELMTLERLVNRHLDDGEAEALGARLAAAELPEPGTERAAALIEELAYGPQALERPHVADRAARRGRP
jgi:hypothetical protein